MTKLATVLISLLSTFVVVFGCGVMPQGQTRTISFTVSGFTLPVSMVYSDTLRPQVPGIAASRDAASSFVSRLLMQRVIDVLEHHGRNAGLPDSVISAILSQLMIQTNYVPLECKEMTVEIPAGGMTKAVMMKPHCIIVGSTVTALCDAMVGGRNNDRSVI
ncbi:hypothetical protein KIN20_016867 [Parelaphostrongylus tenuis]|uniref:Lipoprotein n=1 Tax=Parelaphostrongylus tenuis TaxID=148309 RepID=A0AAD5MH43_PARTN|nr:hypothetical protein KIN20_016867 [Parelaphostrongylus tenuis]